MPTVILEPVGQGDHYKVVVRYEQGADVNDTLVFLGPLDEAKKFFEKFKLDPQAVYPTDPRVSEARFVIRAA
jgi:hypothetical protein